jgi:hypothetical protein
MSPKSLSGCVPGPIVGRNISNTRTIFKDFLLLPLGRCILQRSVLSQEFEKVRSTRRMLRLQKSGM